MKHSPFHHIHPSLVLSLRTRTRWLGTVNAAIALSGRSCGWGSCERPRRTFFAHLRRPTNDTGLHFIELTSSRNAMLDERVLLRVGDANPVAETTEGKETP